MSNQKQNKGPANVNGENSMPPERPLNQMESQGNPEQLKQGDASFQSHDPKNRTGNFEGKGEHSRSGTRGK